MSDDKNKESKYVYLRSKCVVEIRGSLSANNGTQKKKPEAKNSEERQSG